MKNKTLLILLIASFIKGLIWLFSIPIFQIPDEPSHLAYVQFLAEENRRPHPRQESPTSREIFTVANIVNFDWKITHPVWQGYPSNWLAQINAIAAADRRDYQPNSYLTSLKRPGLYYSLAALVYKLFYSQSFLWRFFGIRLLSLVCQIIIIWLTYKISQKLFKNPNLSLAIAAAVSFHPGFSFILSGVSYEALGVLVATLFIYLIVYKVKTIWLLLTATAGILIKPDLIFLWLFLPFYLPRKVKIFILTFLVLVVVLLTLPGKLDYKSIINQYLWLDKWLYVIPIKDYNLYVNSFWQAIFSAGLLNRTFAYLNIFFTIHYHQIFAWYWGVFGWLEKTLPPLIYAVLKILSLVSLVGIAKNWRRVKWLILIVLLQAAIIFANDWLAFVVDGAIYGIQGRYFLPAISAQMILFIYGLSRFISLKLIIIGAIGLNLIGLYSLWQYFGNVWAY